MNSLSLVIITGSRGVPTETTADYLAHDLVHHEDKEGAQEYHPAHGEEEKSKHEEGFVTVGIFLGVGELNLETSNISFLIRFLNTPQRYHKTFNGIL